MPDNIKTINLTIDERMILRDAIVVKRQSLTRARNSTPEMSKHRELYEDEIKELDKVGGKIA